MATAERRPSAQAEVPVAARVAAVETSLDDRLSKLLEGADDELPPMDAPAAPAEAAPAAAVVAEEPAVVEAPAPVAPAVEVAPAPAAVVEAPREAPVASVPLQLVPRPIVNLTPAEKRDASLQAELYSIMVTMDHLESAFVKSVISTEEYETHCKQIVTQFKTLQSALRDKVPDIKVWLHEQGYSFPMAENRLLDRGGVGATTLHGTGLAGKEAMAIHAATEHFITLTNALQINYSSCLELLPLLQELQTSIVGIPNLPQLAGMERITQWLVTLSNMQAHDTLSENQLKQLTLDSDLAYTSFRNWLQHR